MNLQQELAEGTAPAPAPVYATLTVEQLIAAVEKEGAKFVRLGAETRLQGHQLPAALLDAVKRRRTEVLAELEKRGTEERSRWCKVPDEDLPLVPFFNGVPEALRDAVDQYALRQAYQSHTGDDKLLAWISARVKIHQGHGLDPHASEFMACLELVMWQRRTTDPREAIEFVAGLEAAAKQQHQPTDQSDLTNKKQP